MIWTQPPPPERRRALGRGEIVAAAIALVDAEGADALTMKAVAARLGTYSPMALYRYVYSKEGLVDLMLDAAAAEITLPTGPTDDWQRDLRAVATGTRQMLQRHPWYAALVHTRPPAGPHQMHRLEFMLATLVGQGADVADAMTYAALLDRHVIGAGLQDAEDDRMNRRHELEDGSSFVAAVMALHDLAAKDGGLPILTSWLAAPSGPSGDQRFELGLDFLLNGIAARLPA